MITIKRTGEAELQRMLAKMGKAFTPSQAEDDLLVAVRPMVEAAVGNVSLGPPSIHLRENIGASPDADGARSQGWLACVKVGAFWVGKIGEIFYGRFLEFGTVKQAARPWLRPAFDQHRGETVSRLGSLVNGRVIAAVGK